MKSTTAISPKATLEETRHRQAGNKIIGKTFECLRSEWG